ncbi:hypothetical protein [Sphingomonas zeae]|jgi:hypothetical protein
MNILITTTFIDRQEPDPERAEIKAGTPITRDDDRALELIGLGLAECVDVVVANTPSAPDVAGK